MSDGPTEDEFTNRPDNDEVAFLKYEKEFRQSLDRSVALPAKDTQKMYWNSADYFLQVYINNVLAAASELNIEELEYWIENRVETRKSSNFLDIKLDIDDAVNKIKIRNTPKAHTSSIHLDSEIREKIRDFVTKIRATIESVDMPIARKEALMNKLNAFANEVDRDRTRFEAFTALMIEAAGAAGKAETKLRPIRKWIDSIARLFHEARAIEDGRQRLPPPQKRIEAPRQKPSLSSSERSSLSDPSKSDDEFDDDIPF